MRGVGVTIALCCAVSVAACGGEKDDPKSGNSDPSGPSEWPSYGHDGKNTRYNPNERIISRDNVAKLVKKWDSAETGVTSSAVTSTPAVVDGVVYFGDWSGKLHAVRAEDGSSVWTTQLAASTAGPSAQINNSPFVTSDRVYVGGADNLIYAVDRETGAKVWDPHAQIGDQNLVIIWSSPNVADNTLVIGVGSYEVFTNGPYSFRGNVVGVDATSGDVNWTTFLTEGNEESGFGVSVWGSAAMDTERKWAIIGTGQSYTAPASPHSDAVVALDYTTGELQWSRQFTADDIFTISADGPDHDVGASVVLYEIGGRQYVGAGDKGGHFFGLDRETGEILWETELTAGGRTGGVMASPAVADGVIYVYSNDGITENFGSGGPMAGSAFALDAETGKKLWETKMEPGAFGGIAVANGLMFFTTLDGVVHALDTEDGSELWNAPLLEAKAAGGVTVAGGMVFVGAGWDWVALSPSGGVTAFGLPEE